MQAEESKVEVPRKDAATLYRVLRQRIVSGAYGVGERIPTERDLAESFGCSRATVSKALVRLGHEGLVARRTRDGTRVLRSEAREDAPSLALDAVAFIHPGEPHEGIARIAQGFQQAAQAVKRRVVTLTTGIDFRKEAEIVGRLAEFDVKGAAVYPVMPELTDRLHFANMLRKCPFPVVLAEIALPGFWVPSVGVDSFDAGFAMTRHLLDRGLRRIGFLANYAWVPMVRDRYQGYRRAMAEAGLDIDEGRVLLEPAMHPDFDDPVREPTQLARQFLQGARDLQGIVCGDDYLALGCLAAARELGLDVPGRLQVTGVSDYSLAARSEPPLTTYRVPYEEIGRKAFEVLGRMMSGDKPTTMETLLRGAPVARGSTTAQP
jgi:DNA-binding LacI/PurR family transcriptional regulator